MFETTCADAPVQQNMVTQIDYNNAWLLKCLNLGDVILDKLIASGMPEESDPRSPQCMKDQIEVNKNLIISLNKRLEEILQAIG